MGEDRSATARRGDDWAKGRPYLSVAWDDEQPTATIQAGSLSAAKEKALAGDELASLRYPPWPHWEPTASTMAELVYDRDGTAHVVFQSSGDLDPHPSRDELRDRTPDHRLRAYRQGFAHLAETCTELADQRREDPYRGPTTRMDPYTLAPGMAERMPGLVPADDEDPDDPKRFRSEKHGTIWHVVPEGTSRVRIDPAFAFHLYLNGHLKHAGHETRGRDRYCLVQRRDKPRGNEVLHRIAPLFTEDEELPVSYKTAAADGGASMSDRPQRPDPPEAIQRPEAPEEIQEADEAEVSAEPDTEPVIVPDQDDVEPDEKRYACLAYRADPEQEVETRYGQHAMAAAEGFLRWEIKSQTSNLHRDPETGEHFAGAEAEMAWAVTKDGQEFLIVEVEGDDEDEGGGEWTQGELWGTFTATEVAECRQTWEELKEPV